MPLKKSNCPIPPCRRFPECNHTEKRILSILQKKVEPIISKLKEERDDYKDAAIAEARIADDLNKENNMLFKKFEEKEREVKALQTELQKIKKFLEGAQKRTSKKKNKNRRKRK